MSTPALTLSQAPIQWVPRFRPKIEQPGCEAHLSPAYTGLLNMTVRVLTTSHTQYTHSPDATPCDFFLWSYIKDQVYVPPLPASILELKV